VELEIGQILQLQHKEILEGAEAQIMQVIEMAVVVAAQVLLEDWHYLMLAAVVDQDPNFHLLPDL
jgi:hypothetical protein